MQFGEWVKIAILLIEMTESMVLYEEGKRLPSDACQVCRVYCTFSTLYSLLHFSFFSSFSLLSLSTPYFNSLRYCDLHTIVDVSLHCLMIDVVSFSHSCFCSSLAHGYCSFYTQDQSQVISLLYPCFPPNILSAAGIRPIPTTYCFDHVQVGSIPLPLDRQKWVQSHYLLNDKLLFTFGQKPIQP